jgi:hypothetical protein
MMWRMPVVAALLIGAALGLVSAVSDALGSTFPPSDAWRTAAIVANFALVWAGSAVLAGWIARRWWLAALSGLVALLAGVAVYYWYGLSVGDREGLGLDAIWPTARMWITLAVLGGPLLGLVGAVCRLGGLAGLAARLVIPVGILGELVWRLRWGLPRQDPASMVGLSVLLLLAVVLAVLAVRPYLAEHRVPAPA